MNRALFVTLLFVACGPEPVVQPDPDVTPVTEEPGNMMNQNEQPLTGFPCDVREVLQTSCAGCHAGAVYVAHFKSRAALLGPTLNGRHQLGVEIALRLRPDATNPMPPATEKRSSEKSTLPMSGWLPSAL